MGETILFIVFVCLSTAGGILIIKRTGNYDVDYFTKIIGWALFIVGAYGIFELIGKYII
tara:strand:- start:456 stop:632 length:177 start_codon:yes stop_codon:yes gene_type:complete